MFHLESILNSKPCRTACKGVWPHCMMTLLRTVICSHGQLVAFSDHVSARERGGVHPLSVISFKGTCRILSDLIVGRFLCTWNSYPRCTGETRKSWFYCLWMSPPPCHGLLLLVQIVPTLLHAGMNYNMRGRERRRKRECM